MFAISVSLWIPPTHPVPPPPRFSSASVSLLKTVFAVQLITVSVRDQSRKIHLILFLLFLFPLFLGGGGWRAGGQAGRQYNEKIPSVFAIVIISIFFLCSFVLKVSHLGVAVGSTQASCPPFFGHRRRAGVASLRQSLLQDEVSGLPALGSGASVGPFLLLSLALSLLGTPTPFWPPSREALGSWLSGGEGGWGEAKGCSRNTGSTCKAS